MIENTIFFRNIPFEYSEEDFKQKMKKIGKVMYVRYVSKNGQFNGSGFVRFVNKEDAQKLFDMNDKIQKEPEMRSIVDPDNIF